MLKLSVNAKWDKAEPAVHVKAGKHEFLIDDPAEHGGSDKAASAMQYLLGAVAGCFIGMGRMVAKERGLAIGAISLHVEGEIDPVGLTGTNPSVRPGAQEVRMIVEVSTTASREEVETWMAETERRCPVADTVRSAVPMSLRLKGITA